MESLRTLIDALPSPVWTRDIAGALTFVNPAYARAVEAKDPADALARSVELLTRVARDEASRARAAGKNYVDAHAGDRRRLAAQFRRARRADPQGQRRHRHRRDRSRGDAERAQPPQRRPPPHARSTGDRRRHLHRRPAPDVLQRGLSLALGARRRLPRPEPDRFRRARSTARSTEAARGDRTSASGRPPCTRPIAPPRPGSMSGICPMAAPFASSPRPIRRAA